ncbi:MAG: hypothetical protein V7642_576, partial [Burkholderiales bacterium]
MQRRESKVRDGDSPNTSYEEDDKAYKASRHEDAANPVQNDAAIPAAEPAPKAVVEVERNTVIGTKTISAEAEKKQ